MTGGPLTEGWTGDAGVPGAVRARRALLSELRLAAVVALAGVALGAAWAALVGPVSGAAETFERAVASDGTFVVLTTVAGVVTAVLLVRRPGRHAPARVAVVLLASLAGAALAWGTGVVLGAPSLRAVGAVLLWPAVASLLVALGALAGTLRSGD